uniref:Uncharacterized protein n=1 Tax=Moniliophthora roreri TaxID=221103 RepID=A0A0W0FM71_MONRR
MAQIKSLYSRVMKNPLMNSNHWCTLSLLGVSPSEPKHARASHLQNHQGNLFKLKSLNIIPSDEDEEAVDADSCNLFGNCPSLTSLRLRPRDFFTVHGRLSWVQLDTLRLHRCNVLQALVGPAQGVKRSKLINAGGTDPSPQDPIISRAELLLIVMKKPERGIKTTSESNALPNVVARSLWLTPSGPPVTWAWEQTPISNMLLRSQSSGTVTSLTLKFLPITVGQTIELLQVLPTFQRLCIEECYSRGNWIVDTGPLKEVTVDHDRSTGTFLPNTQLNLAKHPGISDDLKGRYV